MNIELEKSEILIQHGLVKGMIRLAKEAKSIFAIDIERLEDELSSARSDFNTFGGYDDCGDCYRQSKIEAEAKLQKGKDNLSVLDKMGFKIQKELKTLKKMKLAFKDSHGEHELLLISNQLEAIGKSRAEKLSLALKNEKEKANRVAWIAQILMGKRLGNSLYKLKVEHKKYGSKINQFLNKIDTLESKVNMPLSKKGTRKESIIYIEYKNEIIELSQEFIMLTNEITDDIELSKKIRNFLVIINENLRVLNG